MRYLITGTAGFIGFHVARHLLDRGHLVTGVDGLTPYYDVALKEARHRLLAGSDAFRPVIGLIEDARTLEAALSFGAPDIVIHLAAQAGVRYGMTNPGAYVDANIRGTWNVLEMARATRPRHLMLASTSSVYGAASKVPFAESDPSDRPLSLYAATKKAMEAMAHSYAHLYRVPTTAFRFFTVYGPWGRPDMALFKFTDAIRSGQPVEIYGEGRMSRDFTYVADLVEAIGRLADLAPDEANRVADDTLSPEAPFRVVNIGGGQPVALLDFVEVLEAALGRPAIRRMLPMQPGDVPRTFAATDLLHRLIGFVPTTDIRTGVEAFVKWYIDYSATQAPR